MYILVQLLMWIASVDCQSYFVNAASLLTSIIVLCDYCTEVHLAFNNCLVDISVSLPWPWKSFSLEQEQSCMK